MLDKGILIVIEGIDGAGKSTQAKLLLEKLRSKGIAAVYFREPSDSKWGRIIKEKAVFADSLSPEEELELFLKDRKVNVRKNLKPALAKKNVVVLDRYYFSTVAYQGAKGLDTKRILEMNEAFAVKPDLIFVMDIDAGAGLKRIENRKRKDKLFEREDYLIKVRRLFKSFCGENIFHVDAEKPINEVSRQISKIVLGYIKSMIP